MEERHIDLNELRADWEALTDKAYAIGGESLINEALSECERNIDEFVKSGEATRQPDVLRTMEFQRDIMKRKLLGE